MADHTLYGRIDGRYIQFNVVGSTLDASQNYRCWEDYAQHSGANLFWDEVAEVRPVAVHYKKPTLSRRVKSAVKRILRRKN